MEHAPKPHDLDTQGLGALALRKIIDEIFATSDAEVFRILALYKDEPDATRDE